MEREFDYKLIDKKWQDHWEKHKAFAAKNDFTLPKFYGLIEFPYPSGAGLHVGHPRSNIAIDVIARKRRMQGYNVLYPIGWDAFGLPTENFAIKNHVPPKEVTEKNINRFREQLKKTGVSFDYEREVNTTDPAYYKWTQWIFLKLLEKGLAYKSEMPINWCPSCKSGLANEEVINGCCERCDTQVIHKVKNQWMLKITEYAQKLLDGLDEVDFLDRVKIQQRNWIGKSEGAEVLFQIKGTNQNLKVFTTRPDTLFGATYMVISPEHPILEALKDSIHNMAAISSYQRETLKKSEFERTELNKTKTGVQVEGISAINPVNNKEIPVWVSDYVLMSYGTGAIMSVPAHDTRDYEFAKKFSLPIVQVVDGGDITNEAFTDIENGKMINSDFLNGLSVKEAKQTIIQWLENRGIGVKKVNYKLRDWVFSRQRYWGEPIPVIHCPHCGIVPLKEEELPLVLPEISNYEPNDSGESPLANVPEWVNVKCPVCGQDAKRETDTMPQWAGSSWYFLRYCDPNNDKELAGKDALSYWMPVDWYNGGMEHTTLHLLYSRFWNHFLYDIGVSPSAEPYRRRTSHGMILGENGEKMSKSRGNVVNPDDIIDEMGADAFRLYEMFMGAFDQAIPWSMNGVKGCKRFLDKVWKLQDICDRTKSGISESLKYAVHYAIKKVSEDYEEMKYNTAIAAMMTLVNMFLEAKKITADECKILLLLLSPVAPHICEEIWENMDFGGHVYQQSWPVHDEACLVLDEVEIAIQINGKVKSRMMIPSTLVQDTAQEYLLKTETVQRLVEGRKVVKLIFVPKRLANIIVS